MRRRVASRRSLEPCKWRVLNASLSFMVRVPVPEGRGRYVSLACAAVTSGESMMLARFKEPVFGRPGCTFFVLFFLLTVSVTKVPVCSRIGAGACRLLPRQSVRT